MGWFRIVSQDSNACRLPQLVRNGFESYKFFTMSSLEIFSLIFTKTFPMVTTQNTIQQFENYVFPFSGEEVTLISKQINHHKTNTT
jgi:hypothetical protein